MLVVLLVAISLAQEKPEYVFGTTVVSSVGLEGRLYLLKPDTEFLPSLQRRKPIGTLYTTTLNIPARSFTSGFPGVTDRFEWFAIEYTGKFWVSNEGEYGFNLLSDDGSKLWIDGKEVIDNDGIHPPREEAASAILSRGSHTLRLAYFQGPREHIALVFKILPPGQDWQVFDMNNFLPPLDQATWERGTIRKIRRDSDR
jgi:PA14 domain